MSVVQRQGSRIAVVGAGIAGLCTAVQIQQALQQSPVSAGAHITIIADKFNTDTTSDGAAGIFRPTADLVGGVPRQLLKQWCEDSFPTMMHWRNPKMRMQLVSEYFPDIIFSSISHPKRIRCTQKLSTVIDSVVVTSFSSFHIHNQPITQ
jgi:predicted NAD/FAD-dependent oxidoreductase